MREPNAKQIDGLLDRLASVDVHSLRRRLETALRRASTGSTERDGYSPNAGLRTFSAGGPTMLVAVGWDTEAIQVTSTEAAALADAAADPTREHALDAARAVVDAVEALARCETALAKIERSGGYISLDKARCDPCATAGFDQKATTYSSVGGYLHHEMRLCADHEAFVEQWGELPSVEQTREHDRTGVWRVTIPA